MNTNMTGFRWFSKIFAFYSASGGSSFSIGRFKKQHITPAFEDEIFNNMQLLCLQALNPYAGGG